jgi:YGGT family
MAELQSSSRRTSEFRQRSPGSPLLFLKRIILIVLAVIEVVLGLRFVLDALGANPNAGFTTFILNVSKPFMAPFNAVLGAPKLNGSGVFHPSILLAMVVYALIAWGLIALLNATGLAVRSEHSERVESLEEREDQGIAVGQGPVVVESSQLTPDGTRTVTTTEDTEQRVV